MKQTKNYKIALSLLLMSGLGATQAQEVWELSRCLDSAQASNKRLQIGRNEMALSLEKQKEVKSNLLPKITANGDYKYYTDLPTQLMPAAVFGGPQGVYKEAQFGVDHNLLGNIQFGMPIYNPDLYGGIKKVKIASEVSRIQQKKTEEEVYFDVSNLYYNAQLIKSQMAFLDKNTKNALALLENVKLLKQQQLVQKTDVSKVELKVKQLETNKKILNSKYEQVINALKLTIGLSENTAIDVAEIQPGFSPEVKEFTPKTSLDMLLLETKSNLLNTELKTLKQSRYLPTAFLYGSWGQMGYGYEKPAFIGGDFYNFYNMGFVGAKISIPIFNGTVTNKKINQKKIELENNDLQKSLVEDKNKMLSKNALLKQQSAIETLQENRLQIKLAQEIYDNVLLQQKEGLASLTDVITADSDIVLAQQGYLTALVDYLKATLELKKVTGNIIVK